MRDIIWTIIVIWVIWRLVDAFRSISATRKTQSSTVNNQNYNQNNHQTNHATSSPKKGELKADAGEYVDYEEVK